MLPAPVSFVDIAGIVKGASEGEGLGNKFLANIREAEAIAQVVRVFDDPDVIHVDGKVDPRSDMETINTELILADLQTIENAIPADRKRSQDQEARGRRAGRHQGRPGSPGARRHHLLLDQERQAGDGAPQGARAPDCQALHLRLQRGRRHPGQTRRSRTSCAPWWPRPTAVFLDAKLESDLVELDEEEAREMLEMNGQDESGLDQLARVGFHTLGLQTYLTAGPKETRAWTIRQGDTAPQAAGVIHSDFQRGFIKAEVVSFDDLVEAGSMAEAKSRGKVRIEGKEYVMADGDVVEFRFNV